MQAAQGYGHPQQHLGLALCHFADYAEACCRGPFWLMPLPCGPLLPVGDDFMGIYDWEVCTLLQLEMTMMHHNNFSAEYLDRMRSCYDHYNVEPMTAGLRSVCSTYIISFYNAVQ